MTDRELLELAAKACGYDTSHHWNAERLTFTPPVIGLCIEGVSTCWNPLENDGDVLRLAAALYIDIDWQSTTAFPEPMVEAYRKHDRETGVGHFCASYPEAEYKRAIVRVAAEIGKAMPPIVDDSAIETINHAQPIRVR